ncbi:K2CO protein, partial [Rhinopomastus cyanomelas]|nr:K2CO protein [Rhinopomastus cyanomelas]
IAPITINEQLLQPLTLELDPGTRAAKHQEKEQIKALNDKFASFIEKVRFLEQQNEGLDMKWSLLRGQNHGQTTLVPVLEAYMGHLKKQLEALGLSKAQLEAHQQAAQQALETSREMYQHERSQRRSHEREAAALRKDASCFFLNKAELEAKVGSLREEVEFLRMVYEEETQQLQAHVSGKAVVVQMYNRRGLGEGGITAEVRAQYEDLARRSRAEAQAWYKGKFEELQVAVGRNASSLRDARSKVATLTRMVHRLHGEVKGAKDQ